MATFRQPQETIDLYLRLGVYKKVDGRVVDGKGTYIVPTNFVEVDGQTSGHVTEITSADLADIRKEQELTSVLIEQGTITQQTIDGLNKDRQAFTDPATGKTYADKGDILSPKNRRKLDSDERCD